MSPFEDALTDLRITGAVLLHERYAPGCAVLVPDEQKLRTLLGHGPHVKLAPFHLVRRGELKLADGCGEHIALKELDVAIWLAGSAHSLNFGTADKALPLEAIIAGAHKPPAANNACAAELICGVFAMQAAPFNPLLAALPPVLRCATAAQATSQMLAKAAELLLLELDAPLRQCASYTRARLLEVFFAEAIRDHQASVGGRVGWLRGLNDAKLSAALTAFHEAPEEHWSVERLANIAALSPSRFAARFRDTLGVTAMEYVARWRLNLACGLLQNTDDDMASIAYAVGYGGGAALSRAFKERVGISPAKWRLNELKQNQARC